MKWMLVYYSGFGQWLQKVSYKKWMKQGVIIESRANESQKLSHNEAGEYFLELTNFLHVSGVFELTDSSKKDIKYNSKTKGNYSA